MTSVLPSVWRVAVALLMGCGVVAAQSPYSGDDTPSPDERPVTALVLSGGGARGAAHIGVLRVLEELHVPVDVVVGTSMGSIVGGMYASGLSPEEIERRVVEVDWRELFTDRPFRKNIPFRRKQDDGLPFFDFDMGIKKGLEFQSGLISGQKLGFLLQTATLHTAGLESFDDLALPFRAVATDLRSGEPVVLDRGELATAIRASMAVPSVFTPVVVEDRVLVDGGLVRNLPVDVAIEIGAERIIAVDISTRLDDMSRMSMFSVANQSLTIYGVENVREQIGLLRDSDLLITPDLEDITSSSFETARLRDAIEVGAAATRASADRLRGFAVDVAAYARFREQQRRDVDRLPTAWTVDRVRIEGHQRVAERLIRSRIKTDVGDELDLGKLQEDLERIYEIGEFQQVAFRLEPGDEVVLVIDVEEKHWGPNYLRFGLALESNIEGDGDFVALTQITRTQLNSRGAEWRTRLGFGSEDFLDSEVYQPLDYRGFLFVAPSVEYRNAEINARTATGELERIRYDLYEVAFDVGAQFRNVGELRLGVVRGGGDVDVLTQSATQPFDFDIGAWRASLAIDQLDNANFPRRGVRLNTELFLSRESLGADTNYETLDATLIGAASFGKNTVVGWADLGSNLGSQVPFFELQQLGGFTNLSGADPGAIYGNVGGTLVGVYYRKVTEMSPTLGEGVYVGGSIEAGGAWDRSSDASFRDATLAGSLFIGADTRFGPLYLAYGRTEDGDDAFYFFLGRLFQDRD